MKPREQRRSVMINARMRSGASWSDALILNLSTRGMMVRSDRPPGPGSYLEIRRGPYVIVARVVWSRSGQFGVQTQDPVPADGLIRAPDAVAAPAHGARGGGPERRSAPRSLDRHGSSRQQARLGQFGALTLAAALGALLLAGSVADLVAGPLGLVQAALAAR